MEGGGTREGGNSPLVLFHWSMGEAAAAGGAYGEALLWGHHWSKTICKRVSEIRACVFTSVCARIPIFAKVCVKSVRAD